MGIIHINVYNFDSAANAKLQNKSGELDLTVMRIPKFIPVLHVQKSLNPRSTGTLVRIIEALSKMNNSALAIVVDIPNHMPVQTDRLHRVIQEIKQRETYPIYGFATEKCSPESYYLLSAMNYIYSYPSTVFTFRRQLARLNNERLLSKLGVKKSRTVSHENSMGSYFDNYSVPGMTEHYNTKETDINERLVKYSLGSRKQELSEREDNQRCDLDEPGAVLLGEEALEKKLVDGHAYYLEFLKMKYPESIILNVEYSKKHYIIAKVIAFVGSPLLLLLFLIKVLIKYSIIMYLYLKHFSNKEGRTFQQLEQEAEDTF